MRLHLLEALSVFLVPASALAQALGGMTPVMPPASPAISIPRAAAVAEPNLPTNPSSPTDFQAPATPPGGGGGEGAEGAAPEAPTSFSGGDMIIEEGRSSLYGGEKRARSDIPPYHEVRKGDTLWNLCAYYYGDPWSWPQVWAFNKTITNPHWIYPGDRVRLPGGKTVVPGGGAPSEVMRVRRFKPREETDIYLRQNAFVDAGELKKAGSIVGSKIERRLLSEFDEIYLEGKDAFKPQNGEELSIYKVKQALKDKEGKFLGHMVEILGSARVKRERKSKATTGVITESLAPIERGSRIGPIRRRFVRQPILPAEKDLEGNIIATFRGSKYVATDELVFVDRGRSHGVQQGNRFLVLRWGDGFKRLLQDKDDENKRFPREAVAELTVLDVRDKLSVALVTRTTKELRVGDYLRMRRGY